jgi:hypothetical protein
MPNERTFQINIQRLYTDRKLVTGSLLVNGELIGRTYENDDLKVAAGAYVGRLRYHSDHNFVQGPFGIMSKKGDFLVEVVGVPNRTNILFHGGNRPHHSKGCILLGPVTRDEAAKTSFIGEDHTLHKLRLKFYGSEVPDQCPDQQISIRISDINACNVPE